MKTLEAIKKALIELNHHPEPDDETLRYAASLLRDANDLAALQGVRIERVGRFHSPVDVRGQPRKNRTRLWPERL